MNESVVISYIISRWIIWAIVLILLLVIFAIFSFVKSICNYRWWTLILLILFTIYVSVPTMQGLLDIKNNSYVREHVRYYRDDQSNTRNSLVASDSIQITLDNGNTIILRGSRRDLPYGESTGNVTYSKRSKIIIDFVPDTEK